jgi:hypothetical protein
VAWTNQQIGAFLETVMNSWAPPAVSDFVFKDFDADGQLELLAAVDLSGRELFNTLVVVRRQKDSFSVQQIETIGIRTLKGTFADLNGDGSQELLVPTPITPYLGAATPQATWTAIYGWSGLLLVDQSNQSSAYYESAVLPGLLQKLNDLQSTSPGTIQLDIAQIGYDKILRVAEKDPTAGLMLALTWAATGDSTHRILAADVLADIGTATALAALQKLSQDADPNVVIYAQAALHSLPALHFNSVQIEIKPGTTTAPINLRSQGSIPVAILSTSTFDAPTSVDTRTLTFGSGGTEDSFLFCDPNGEDVNGDGIPDLVCHFSAQASSFQLGDAAGTLEGRLKSGMNIKGAVAIVVVGN